MAKKIIPLKYNNALSGSPMTQSATASIPESILTGGTNSSRVGLHTKLQQQMKEFEGLDTSNIFANFQNQFQNMENVYEEMEVPTEAYELKKRQREQGLATSLQAMRESGMGAGSAQALANAALKGAAEDTAQISQDLFKADQMKRQEAGRLQEMELRGEQEALMTRMKGEESSRALEYQKLQGLMSLTAGELASQREASANKGKIICDELYKQGYLEKYIWEADERFGDIVREKDPRLLFGYHIWAIYVVNFMKAYPHLTKYVHFFAKPWTEHMAYMMGVSKKKTLIGKFSHWLGTKVSYFVANRVMRKNKNIKLV